MLFLIIRGLRRLAAAFKCFMRAAHGSRNRRAMHTMLLFEDRFLRDIGLTRADIIDCLSSPEADAVDFLDERRMRGRSTIATAYGGAAPTASRLAG